jgi:hypothetical protein
VSLHREEDSVDAFLFHPLTRVGGSHALLDVRLVEFSQKKKTFLCNLTALADEARFDGVEHEGYTFLLFYAEERLDYEGQVVEDVVQHEKNGFELILYPLH